MQAPTPVGASENGPPTSEARLLVSLATYNEHDNIGPLIEAIHQQAPQADVLVIDDNSPDGTGKLADELVREDARPVPEQAADVPLDGSVHGEVRR